MMDLVHRVLKVLAEAQLRHINFASLDIRLVTQGEIVEVIDVSGPVYIHYYFRRTDVICCLRLQATARRITRPCVVEVNYLLLIFLTWRDCSCKNIGLFMNQFHCLPLFCEEWLLKYLLSIGITLWMHFEKISTYCYCDYFILLLSSLTSRSQNIF